MRPSHDALQFYPEIGFTECKLRLEIAEWDYVLMFL